MLSDCRFRKTPSPWATARFEERRCLFVIMLTNKFILWTYVSYVVFQLFISHLWIVMSCLVVEKKSARVGEHQVTSFAWRRIRWWDGVCFVQMSSESIVLTELLTAQCNGAIKSKTGFDVSHRVLLHLESRIVFHIGVVLYIVKALYYLGSIPIV